MNSSQTIEKLSKKLNQTSEGLDSGAAVVILLKKCNQGLQVLFVKRAEKATDPWSGQTALPGGKRDPEDRNIKETAIRETLEETNINLLDGCRFLGATEPLSPVQRPEMMILPFVVFMEKEQTIRLNEELTEYFWVPLKQLVQCKGTVKFSFGEYPAYIIEGNIVWGLTYRIISKFVDNL